MNVNEKRTGGFLQNRALAYAMKRSSTFLKYTGLGVLILVAGCTKHIDTISDATLKELQVQVEASLVKKLKEQPGFTKVIDVAVLETVSDPKKGVVTMGYQVSFESESAQEGRVIHVSGAKVTLVRKNERDWSLTTTEATSQELVFQDDVVSLTP